jgi:hypothetical protein
MFRYLLCGVLLCVVVAEEGKCASQEEDHGEGVEDYDLDDDADYEDEEDLYDDEDGEDGEDEDYEYDEDDDDPEDYEYEDRHFVHGEL